mmetsp:Transcript_5897/g.15400  ORF Transcript_5897/g.15400 Transcript_5897/m.15400 type:complete len:202 (+) Transcript_5897:322-927(+)
MRRRLGAPPVTVATGPMRTERPPMLDDRRTAAAARLVGVPQRSLRSLCRLRQSAARRKRSDRETWRPAWPPTPGCPAFWGPATAHEPLLLGGTALATIMMAAMTTICQPISARQSPRRRRGRPSRRPPRWKGSGRRHGSASQLPRAARTWSSPARSRSSRRRCGSPPTKTARPKRKRRWMKRVGWPRGAAWARAGWATSAT